ncbi:MAG: hypothetical protein IPF81_12790 [Bacteroidetes bacterium]|nr:hypothetical protein [Bacteroidota bacterium]
MSDVNNVFEEVEFKVMLQTDMQKAESLDLPSKKYFISMSNYIDLNVIWKGKSLVLSSDKITTFILSQLGTVNSAEQLGEKLLNAYINEEFSETEKKAGNEKEKPKVSLGGYFVTEYEYHQEPDGVFHSMLEINQTRIFVAAEINSSDQKNRISFLGEWNPIPEEVIHQVDEVTFVRDSVAYTISNPGDNGGMIHMGSDEMIPFERLYVKVANVAGTKVNVTAGQFRNPFGFWSDYTSHRNFTSTKGNQLVNGFALKKIDLGVKLDGELKGGWEWAAAIMHGRLSRTSPLSREDTDDMKDFCGHLRYNAKKFSLGASAYLAEFNTKRIALGLDYQVNFKKITISGETVYQRNSNPSEIFSGIDDLKEFKSLSSYLQFDLELSHKFHLYGLYEIWDFRVDNVLVAPNPEAKLFHGIKYIFNNNLHWMVIEYGHMFHKGYDKGFTHFSTSVDLTF